MIDEERLVEKIKEGLIEIKNKKELRRERLQLIFYLELLSLQKGSAKKDTLEKIQIILNSIKIPAW